MLPWAFHIKSKMCLLFSRILRIVIFYNLERVKIEKFLYSYSKGMGMVPHVQLTKNSGLKGASCPSGSALA